MKQNLNNGNNLTLLLAKDFGFEGYYPMLNQKNWEELKINNKEITIYADNYYDKIEFLKLLMKVIFLFWIPIIIK